jgi:hypothetical protein
VQSSDYSVEFGRSGGAQVNVVLKSGANQFHGSLFDFFRNRRLDAKNFFDLPDCAPASTPGPCAQIPRFDRNQFGGTLGGPVRRDKTFFFGAYEGLRLRQATTRQATLPSQVQRSSPLAVVPPSLLNPDFHFQQLTENLVRPSDVIYAGFNAMKTLWRSTPNG